MSKIETHTETRTVVAAPAALPKKSELERDRYLALAKSTPLPTKTLDQITSLAAKGWTEAAIRTRLRIPRGEWRARKQVDEALKDYLAEGMALDLGTCLHALREAALTSKNKLRNDARALTAVLGYLKLRHGLRDHGNTPPPEGGGVRVTINLPAPMSREQFTAQATVIDAPPAPFEAPTND